MWLILLLVVGLSIVAFLWFKRGKSTKKNSQRSLSHRQQKKSVTPSAGRASTPKNNSQFHAIEVVGAESSCEAATAIKDKRFLSSDAPTLPVNGCDNPNCHCHYQHHDDRRSDEDRRLQFGVNQDLHSLTKGERRGNRGRRKDDR